MFLTVAAREWAARTEKCLGGPRGGERQGPRDTTRGREAPWGCPGSAGLTGALPALQLPAGLAVHVTRPPPQCNVPVPGAAVAAVGRGRGCGCAGSGHYRSCTISS